MRDWTYTLTDRDGAAHEYYSLPFPGEEGLKMAMNLVAVCGPALGKMLEKVDVSGVGSMADLSGAQIDIAAAVGEIVKGAVMVPDLCRKLLAHTSRDGVKLRDAGAFDAAYAANYAELGAAVKRVVLDNGFLSFFAGFGAQNG